MRRVISLRLLAFFKSEKAKACLEQQQGARDVGRVMRVR